MGRGMLLLHCVRRLKETDEYRDVPFDELIDAIRAAFDTISELLIEEGEGAVFQIPRFGTFTLKNYKGHVARNPKDGSKVRVPDRLKLKFQTSPALLRRMNKDLARRYARSRGI